MVGKNTVSYSAHPCRSLGRYSQTSYFIPACQSCKKILFKSGENQSQKLAVADVNQHHSESRSPREKCFFTLSSAMQGELVTQSIRESELAVKPGT
jgi:hypothetical protein